MTNQPPTERLPDRVMLDDFERLLGMPDATPDDQATSAIILFELAKFIDEHGSQILLLARTCCAAAERQGVVL